MSEDICVEVAYADKTRQFVRTLHLPVGATVKQAISRSDIFQEFPQLRECALEVGIYSRKSNTDAVLQDGDRVEIYRPLEIDPKQARRLRAQKRKG